jgi:hypothetical protein
LKDSGDILDDKAKVKIEKTQENLPNAEIKENLNKVKTEFDSNKVIQEEKEEKKKKGKYIKKADRFQEQEEFSKSVSGLGSFALGLIITRLPNPIALTEEEATEFNKHFEKVAFKYSNFLGEYQSEAALLSVAALIVFPRLKKIKKAEIGNVDSNKKE